jgi:Flp pilus assembly protein TadB
MSDTQYIRVSLAAGVVMGVAIASTGEIFWTAVVVISAVGLAAWSVWSNEQ